MIKLPAGVHFFERGWLSSNNILFLDADSAILVDSGYWTHSDQTFALIEAQLQGRQLSTLFNTHLHSDHCGGNAYLQSKFSELKTYIPPGHAEFVQHWNADKLSYTPTGQHCPPFKFDGLLQNGDVFKLASSEWRIHAAPGHDPHSVILFDEKNSVLISADALWENGFGVVFPEIEGRSAFDEVEATLNVIEDLNPKIVLPGHGSPFSDVAGAISRARSRLHLFRSAPDKHASYAAKVLLKFKLLELQAVDFLSFFNWAEDTDLLRIIYSEHAANITFEAWILDLCASLEKVGACRMTSDGLVNIE